MIVVAVGKSIMHYATTGYIKPGRDGGGISTDDSGSDQLSNKMTSNILLLLLYDKLKETNRSSDIICRISTQYQLPVCQFWSITELLWGMHDVVPRIKNQESLTH